MCFSPMFVTVIAKIMFYVEFLLNNLFYFVPLFKILPMFVRGLFGRLFVAPLFAKSGRNCGRCCLAVM